MKLDEVSLEAWPMFWAKMTTTEIRHAAQTIKIAMLPVGSIEQHGDHLPVDTDFATIEYLAERSLIAARKELKHPVSIIAPGIPYGGPGLGMQEWPGTICLRPEVLMDAVVDIGKGIIDAGFKCVLVLNGCFGNISPLTLAVQKLKSRVPEGEFILAGSSWSAYQTIQEVRDSEPGGIGHAGELETSTSLVIDPDHVDMTKAVVGKLTHVSPDVSFDFDGPGPFYWPLPFSQLTQSGVIGDPTVANKEKGEAILEASIQGLVDTLTHVHNLL
jgi:creatinine amidohydrolase